MTRRPAPILFVALLSLGVSPALAATRNVPASYVSIQAAIDAASPGDEILVAAGSYPETLNTRGKRLDLKSVSGPEATVIDGRQMGSVVRMTGGGSVDGFTIRNGRAPAGGGIVLTGHEAVSIKNNIVELNVAGIEFDSGLGGGICALDAFYVSVNDNTIRNNYSGYLGGGVSLEGIAGCEMRRNQILSNEARVGGGGAQITDVIATDNIIANNIGGFGGGGLMAGGGALQVTNNTVAHNVSNNGFPSAAGILGSALAPSALFARNLVVFNTGPGESGIGFSCLEARVECNVAWGNDLDYELTNCDTSGGPNRTEDPLLCVEHPFQFLINGASPCAPANSDGCGLIGAGEVGCGGTPARSTSWGGLKRRYVSAASSGRR